jgi:hypothetical protein
MTDEERIAELQLVLQNAQQGISVAESDIAKFEKQLQEGQKLNDEAVRLLMEKNPTWTVGQAMDAIYQSKLHKLTHLEESKAKALSALSFFRGKLKKATEGIKRIETEKREEEAKESANNLFKRIGDFVAAYNSAQSILAELKVLVVSHPATDDLVRRAEMLGFHTCFGITAYTHLNPATLGSLTMDSYAGQLSELIKGGVGSYNNIPSDLKISYDGTIQTPFPVDTPFMKRTNPTGIQETDKQLLGRAERRLNEILNPKRERRSRFVA